jgi:hypothetical protein
MSASCQDTWLTGGVGDGGPIPARESNEMPQLRPLWAAHTHRRLVEPFCGGLAVTLGLHPERALPNAASPHLINFDVPRRISCTGDRTPAREVLATWKVGP